MSKSRIVEDSIDTTYQPTLKKIPSFQILFTSALYLLQKLLYSMQIHSMFIFFVIGYTIAGFIVAWFYNKLDLISIFTVYNKDLVLTLIGMLSVFISWRTISVMIYVRPKRLTRYIIKDLKEHYFNMKRLLVGLPILIFMPIFMSIFSFLKQLIPVINPYTTDTLLLKCDLLLHGNVLPWQLLQTFLNEPIVSSGISFLYNSWIIVMYAVLLWQIFSLSNPFNRMQFLLTFIGCWSLLGTIVATLFSSVGPCYYGNFNKLTDPFLPLMTYLREANETSTIWSIELQDRLLRDFQNNEYVIGSGISAMPSLHVAMAFLFAVIGWKKNRTLGVCFTIYLVFIMIGSVHLGWHYAVDGYVSIIATWVIWYTVGKFLECRHPIIH